MSTKLSTLINKIDSIPNKENISIIKDFQKYMHNQNSSENHQINNLKVVMNYAKYLGKDIAFYDVKNKEQVISFLNTKIKNLDVDPDKRWITTWNHFLNRIILFMRWLHNYHTFIKKNKFSIDTQMISEYSSCDWKTPYFCKIQKKKTKRISPYMESEIWTRDEFLSLIKYEPNTRNKAILALMWDLDARPHEITLLRIKHIRLKERYGEGEIPYEAKTGTGPILLICSFPYVRDWLNQHPFANESNAKLICNLNTGSSINPKSIWNIMEKLKQRIIRLLNEDSITDKNEKEQLQFFLRTKKWNPYCIRHSAITADSDYLPDYALKKKVRWSMNSKQGTRYIKRRMGDELKNKILARNGIKTEEIFKQKHAIHLCSRCNFTNAIDIKYCSKCSYPLTPQAFEEIKEEENMKFKALEEKYKLDIKNIKEEIDQQINDVIDLIKQEPRLMNIKIEALKRNNLK